MTAETIIEALGMARHPEGGWYKETFRDPEGPERRGASTAIYYLLEKGDRSHWHQVDATEVWHFYTGAPLKLSISGGTGDVEHVLGPELADGQRPQVIVPKGHWQSAESLGNFTLVGCTVAPGFVFSGFEMAPEGWAPG